MKKVVVVFSMVLLVIIAYLFIIGFSFPVEKMPKSFVVTAVIDNKETELCVISEEDTKYQQIKQIILKNETGWRVDINSYIPFLKMQSDYINIVILNGWVVNFEHEYFGWV